MYYYLLDVANIYLISYFKWLFGYVLFSIRQSIESKAIASDSYTPNLFFVCLFRIVFLINFSCSTWDKWRNSWLPGILSEMGGRCVGGRGDRLCRVQFFHYLSVAMATKWRMDAVQQRTSEEVHMSHSSGPRIHLWLICFLFYFLPTQKYAHSCIID
jgi:hypothetical protein